MHPVPAELDEHIVNPRTQPLAAGTVCEAAFWYVKFTRVNESFAAENPGHVRERYASTQKFAKVSKSSAKSFKHTNLSCIQDQLAQNLAYRCR